MKLFINKNEYGYSTTCKDKEKNIKTYLQVGFKKGDEPTTDQIEISNAFFSCFQNKNGIQPKLVVMEYNEIGKKFEDGQASSEVKEEPKVDNDPFADFQDKLEIEDNFLD